MAIFVYRAKNNKGQLIEGMVDADSKETVASLLNDKGLFIIEIERKRLVDAYGLSASFLNRVPIKDLVFFFREMAVMIESDLPIVRVLRILVKQTSNKYFKMVIADVADEVDGGAKVSEAMTKYPDVFNDFYVNMIASGETSGRLSDVINYLADQQEKDYDLRSRVKGAMYYPAFILAALVAVGALMMMFVVPQITEVLNQSGVELPLTTKILIGTSSFFQFWWWLVLIVLLIIILGLKIFINTDLGRYWLDWLKLKIPVFGKIYREIIMVRITLSLHTLMAGGVTITDSLLVIRNLVGNVIYEDLLDQAISGVKEGSNLADSLLADGGDYIPFSVSQMISVGEETGKLEKISKKLADFYAREVEASIRNLSVLIEPIIMVILAVAVAIFVLAIITPMWQLSAAI